MVLHVKNEKRYPASVSKHNSKCKNLVDYKMISNREGWHDIAAEKHLIY